MQNSGRVIFKKESDGLSRYLLCIEGDQALMIKFVLQSFRDGFLKKLSGGDRIFDCTKRKLII